MHIIAAEKVLVDYPKGYLRGFFTCSGVTAEMDIWRANRCTAGDLPDGGRKRLSDLLKTLEISFSR
jgi:hypothetical protein